MIGRIAGIILHRAQDHVLIDVRGVGYIVHVSERTAASLPAAGRHSATRTLGARRSVAAYRHQPAGKEWHRLLTSVQGAGAKVALAISLHAWPRRPCARAGAWRLVGAAQGAGRRPQSSRSASPWS